MDRNPKNPLKKIFKDNYLTRLWIGVAVAARWPPSSKLPVVECNYKSTSTKTSAEMLKFFELEPI
jgi:hypothetical protein